MRWLSVPPDVMRNPWLMSAFASVCAFVMTCFWYALNSGLSASPNAIAFAAMMFTLPKGRAFSITGGAVIGFAYLVMIYYQIRWIIDAFKEAPLQGALHLIPVVNSVYPLYYLITRWDRVGKWFIAQLKMLPLMMLGGLLYLLGVWLGWDWPEEKNAWLTPVHNLQVACQSDFDLSDVSRS